MCYVTRPSSSSVLRLLQSIRTSCRRRQEAGGSKTATIAHSDIRWILYSSRRAAMLAEMTRPEAHEKHKTLPLCVSASEHTTKYNRPC